MSALPAASHSTSHSVSSRLGHRLLAAVLVLACVLAQTLGALHGVVHAPGLQAHQAHQGHDVGHQALHEHTHADHPGACGVADVLARLFANHAEEADCRHYDQLSHGDVLISVPLVVLPLALAPFVLSVLSGLATARWHALFDARGPPTFR